jgi:hypothetical protein
MSHEAFGDPVMTSEETRKLIMKRVPISLLAVAVVAATTILAPTMKHHFASVPVVHAQSGCSTLTLNGNYGFTFGGFQIQHGTQRSVPFYGAGLASFDAATGNASATFSFGVNGKITTNQPYTATYTVNSDCTGSVTATPGSGGDNFTFVIVSDGAEVLAVDTSTGETLTADFKKQ